jgi:anion-transporting  ArsA/GET3 family ATPase
MPAMQDSRWYNAPQEERNRIVARYLSKRSQFSQLQDRIEQYLRLENKDLALAETAVKLIQTFAANYQRNSEEMNRILHENYDVTQLKKEQKDKIRLREKYKAEAESFFKSISKYKATPPAEAPKKASTAGDIKASTKNKSADAAIQKADKKVKIATYGVDTGHYDDMIDYYDYDKYIKFIEGFYDKSFDEIYKETVDQMRENVKKVTHQE